MYNHCFLLLLLCLNVLCDNCVVFNFEANFTNDFTFNYGLCSGRSEWNLRRYNDLSLEAPHENSSYFIAPKSELSCISSFVFPITTGGTFDVNFYMESAAQTDYIIIIVSQFLESGVDPVTANVILSPMDPNLIRGWQTVKFFTHGLQSYNGYVTLYGFASESSVILIDSIRYMSPTYSEELCEIYKEDAKDDASDTTTTIIEEPTPSIMPETTIIQPKTTTIKPEATTKIMPETTSPIIPETISTTKPETTSTISSETTPTIMPETTSTIMPEATWTTIPEITSTIMPDTTSTSKSDTTTETSTTSLTTTTENYPETSSMTNNCYLNKNDVRVNVNINIQ